MQHDFAQPSKLRVGEPQLLFHEALAAAVGFIEVGEELREVRLPAGCIKRIGLGALFDRDRGALWQPLTSDAEEAG